MTMLRTFGYVANLIYTVISLSLLLISLSMVAYAVWEVWIAINIGQKIINKMLDAIGLVVIAAAVFDVAKYLIEEEVLRQRELRSAREARETLTKFLVIIIIAVSLEALVFIFGAGSKNIADLLYPTFLLATSALTVVGLGIFQRLSTGAEQRVAVSTTKPVEQ